MKTITLTCETVTPLFLAGADGTTPELRAPSIKGALRFWWRAMNGHLSLNMLKQQETEIFGGTSRRSTILLRILNESDERETKISLTPHHRENYCQKDKPNCHFKNGKCNKSLSKKGKFVNFDLVVCFDNRIIGQQEVEKLVKVTFLLGGLGKRSRRGFGSIRVSKVNGSVVLSSLPEIENFINTIPQNQNLHLNYPLIKNIKVGKSYNSYEELLIRIGESSHLYKDDSLGYARQKERLASPIYTSIIRNNSEFYPIITTLNNMFGNTSKQDDYRGVILS